MEWQLVWGGDREEGLLAVELQTGETPNVLLNKPRLHTWLEWYWNAFWMLDPGRPVHQGSIGRIPLSEIAAYLVLFGPVETEPKLLFIKTMKALDSVYVKLQNERITREVEQKRKADEAARQR